MTAVGPQGAARFNYHGKYRLAVGADSTVYLHLTDPASADIDLSVYDAATPFVGAGRRERNEALTDSPLFTISGALTPQATHSSGPDVPDGTDTDGYLTLTISGSELEQDTPSRGYFDVFGRTASGASVLLVTGRFVCEGGTVDPVTPASA